MIFEMHIICYVVKCKVRQNSAQNKKLQSYKVPIIEQEAIKVMGHQKESALIFKRPITAGFQTYNLTLFKKQITKKVTYIREVVENSKYSSN
jgi:hypothetical protein